MKTETYFCDQCGNVMVDNWYLVEVPEPRSEVAVEESRHFCGRVCLVGYFYTRSWASQMSDIRNLVNKG